MGLPLDRDPVGHRWSGPPESWRYPARVSKPAESISESTHDWRTGVVVASSILCILALRRIPLPVALPSTAISYVGAALIGHFLYNEPITTVHVAALAIVGCCVALLAVAVR
jgi:multidrug transporter EmrE-like cation transporter